MFDKVDMQKPKHLLAIIGTFFIFAALPLTVYLVLTSQERAREGPQAAVDLKGDLEESTFVSGLSQPTSMAFAPDGRLFVTEKGGNVRVIKDGKLLSTPFLTVSVNTDRERGLIGVALDPDFETNGYVYIHYTHQVNTTTVRGKVSRFTASSTNPDVAFPNSEVVILGNIFSGDGHHDGGGIHFGKDGFLYIATGDGGNDFGNNSQNLGNLAGKILRINKDGSIPSDNPFAGQTGKRGEIWAYGLRNPFTFNIDPVDGKIFANDVGQSTWEEVNKIEKGANYGWPGCEGPAFGSDAENHDDCANFDYTYPIYWYNHSEGSAITGAAFYRGNQFPSEYTGKYFFSDIGGGFIRSLHPTNYTVSNFTTNIQGPVDIQVGLDGALYYLSFFSGQVHKIQFAPPNAIATVDEVIGPISVTRSFSGSASSDINQLPLTYSWDFGDGTFGFGKKSSHTYDSYGLKEAKLTVTNSHGATSESETLKIIVAKCADVIGTGGIGSPPNGVVNITDIGALIIAFGSTSSSPDWNEIYDLDASGNVNILDIGFSVAQFGAFCSV